MDELKKALKKLGWKPDQINFFFDAENRAEDGPTMDDVIGNIQNAQKDVFKSKLGPELIQSGVDDAILTYQKGERSRIAKMAGMGLTRKDTDGMTLDDVIDQSKAFIQEQKDAVANTSNEDTLVQLNEWKGKFTTLKHDFEELEGSKDEAIAAAQSSADSRVAKFQVDKLTTGIRDFRDGKPREWARESDKLAGHHYIMSQINEKYDIQVDGGILNKDGTKAVNFEENNTFEKANEAYDYLFHKLEYGKVSNGSQGGPGKKEGLIVNGLPASGEQSEATKAMLARGEKKQRR